MTPRVSIVLPTYQRAGMLGGAIDSCLNQTFEELELIVVNDGSRDGTLEVARERAERDPRVVVLTQSNQGLPAALNHGFSKARGGLWTWSSDDNRYHPGAIAAMVRFLEDDPECALVYCDFQLVDTEGNVAETVRNREPVELAAMNVVGPCFLYRRSVAERAGKYDEDLRYVEDWDYWLRLASLAPIRRLGQVHYDFLDHEENLSNKRQLEVLEATLKMRRQTLYPEAAASEFRKPVARRLATLHWAAGRKARAIRCRIEGLLGL